MNYFNPGAFVSNFHYLVSGMLGIFLVIGIIILFTMLLNRVFRKKLIKELFIVRLLQTVPKRGILMVKSILGREGQINADD